MPPVPRIQTDVSRVGPVTRVQTPTPPGRPTSPTPREGRRFQPFPLVESPLSAQPLLQPPQTPSFGSPWPETPAFPELTSVFRTPEWQEYRRSIRFDSSAEWIAVTNSGISLPTELASSLTSSRTSSSDDNSNSNSSTRGIFESRLQHPVHLLDFLQVVLNNLEAISSVPEVSQNYPRGSLHTLRRKFREILQLVQSIPEFPTLPPREETHFRAFLLNQKNASIGQASNIRNLADPTIETSIERLKSCLAALVLHKQFFN